MLTNENLFLFSFEVFVSLLCVPEFYVLAGISAFRFNMSYIMCGF